MTIVSAILVCGGGVYALAYWVLFGAVPREIRDVLDGGYRCLDCGRVLRRDDVFVTDAGPVCRVKDGPDGCYAARDEDDEFDYRPLAGDEEEGVA